MFRLARKFLPRAARLGCCVAEIRTPLQRSSAFSTNLARKEVENVTITNVTPTIHNLKGYRDESWWTGKSPLSTSCPGVCDDGMIHSLPQLNFDPQNCTKESIQAYFDNTWSITETLFSALQGEDAFRVPPYHDLRHPLIFYYGHPAVFYVNKLRVSGLTTTPINPYFESIFEVGVDEMSWDDLSKNHMPWPSVAEVHQYRKKVHSLVTKVISSLTESQVKNINQSSPLWALVLAFEHERIHIETSSVLMNEMPLKYLSAPPGFPSYHPRISTLDNHSDSSTSSSLALKVQRPEAGKDFPLNQMIPLPAQQVTLGKPRSFPSFGWDNEYGSRSYQIPAFRAAKFKTSNGEFFQFVRDGGYGRRELWTESGWKWRAFRNVKWPTFWVNVGPQGLHHFRLRLLFDEVEMPWDLPVCVNLHEAVAFANWKAEKEGKPQGSVRILTELEHHAIRASAEERVVERERLARGEKEVDPSLSYPVGGPSKQKSNISLSCSSMSPVDAFPANSQGFHDVEGNAWEWTMDYFCPLPGFEVHKYYEDFSTPCFDGLHHVIQGGSFITTGNEASLFSRFHFRPHFFQHASFRLVEQEPSQLITSDTEAPGPYVGSYPFRSDQNGARVQELKSQETLQQRNSRLSQQFGHVSVPLSIKSALARSLVDQVPAYSQSLLSLIQQGAKLASLDLSTSAAIDVGCGPGALTFELSRHMTRVLGIDHSGEEIELANQILRPGKDGNQGVSFSILGGGDQKLSFSINRDGSLTSHLAQPGSGKVVSFRQADPLCLPAELQGFDLVVLNDVLDKMASPNSFFGRLGGARGLIRPGGMFVLVSSFNWNQNTTPKSLWVGGRSLSLSQDEEMKGEEYEDCVQETEKKLSDEFDLLLTSDMPVLWRESISEMKGKNLKVMIFKRK